MLDAFNESYQVKRLHPTGRRGIITLIPKSRRNILELHHWHPIILLVTDYKLIAKVIANRLKITLDNLIDKDKTGFISGRNIAHNIRKVIDVDQSCLQNKISGLLQTIDFQKAFDMVEYKSLTEMLKWLNFGEYVID